MEDDAASPGRTATPHERPSVGAGASALHGTIFMEVDMTDAVNMREHLGERWEKSFGVRLSLNHLVLKATARALKEQPALSPRWKEDGPRAWEQVNLGVSIFAENGLVTPVLRDAESLSLVEIASQVARFYERAAEGRLSEAEMSNGTLTVTNLGKYGVDVMDLVTDPSDTAVLGLGRCVKKPVVVDDKLEFRWLMTLSLSFDGRTMDGARAAQFLSLVKDILERPTLLML